MAYTHFDATKPTPVAKTITQMADDMRANLMALRDQIISAAGFENWPATPAGGTNEQPATITYSNGTERWRKSITWGSTGGADGNPTQIVYEYSSNSGSSYDTVRTKTISWNSDGTWAGTTWS